MNALAGYLKTLTATQQTELLLIAGRAPLAQTAGTLTPLPGEGALEDLALRQLVREVVGDAKLAVLGARGALDVVSDSAHGRLRCVCMQGAAGLTVLVRVLPAQPPSCDVLGVQAHVKAMAHVPDGLVIVTGTAGSGKTTLLGALVDHINADTHKLVVTIDEPIEVLHPRKQAVVSQLHVGTHCNSFEHGIRSAMAMDADVIVVGELDAPGALGAAIEACAGGALVLGGVRASGAAHALERLLASVHPDARARTRLALAEACVGIVVQQLSAKKSGGHGPSQETFARSPALSNAIREGKVAALTGV